MGKKQHGIRDCCAHRDLSPSQHLQSSCCTTGALCSVLTECRTEAGRGETDSVFITLKLGAHTQSKWMDSFYLMLTFWCWPCHNFHFITKYPDTNSKYELCVYVYIFYKQQYICFVIYVAWRSLSTFFMQPCVVQWWRAAGDHMILLHLWYNSSRHLWYWSSLM